ncbi:MAG: argininosuccinate lyase [Deltaproteobacteria bacterium]|nr:argininosuccinate lyase [Deltaproteobacteria bacterium]
MKKPERGGTRGQGEGGRLREGPAPELVAAAFGREIADAPILYRGLSLADFAHVLMLIDVGVIPKDPGAQLLQLLLDLHALPLDDFPLDANLEDVYSNREAWVKKRDEAVAGWLGAGRPRREPATIAYRMAVRERLLDLAGAIVSVGEALVAQAADNVDTVVPDYTYLQPATPTSLAHYLLAFTYPLLRDAERLRAAFARTNQCPGGIGNINGSRLPLDRRSLGDLLGFDDVVSNTRDAMWQVDQPIEVVSLALQHLLHLDRLAEDLQIWNTQEFAMVELADRHARISMIMPQKKNPYALAYVRGITGSVMGRLVSMTAVAKTPSGQMDNRIFALGEVPRTLDDTTATTRLMAGVVAGLRFDRELMRERAGQGFTSATDLAELVMQAEGLSYRQAHRLVGLAVRLTLEADREANVVSRSSLEAAAREVLGRPLTIAEEALQGLADPAEIVGTRRGVGGAAAEPVNQMMDECRSALADHEQWRRDTSARIQAREERLLELARERAAPKRG